MQISQNFKILGRHYSMCFSTVTCNVLLNWPQPEVEKSRPLSSMTAAIAACWELNLKNLEYSYINWVPVFYKEIASFVFPISGMGSFGEKKTVAISLSQRKCWEHSTLQFMSQKEEVKMMNNQMKQLICLMWFLI